MKKTTKQQQKHRVQTTKKRDTTTSKTELLDLKAGTHKQAQQSSLLALTSSNVALRLYLLKLCLLQLNKPLRNVD